MVLGMRDPKEAFVGDTFKEAGSTSLPHPSFRQAQPVVSWAAVGVGRGGGRSKVLCVSSYRGGCAGMSRQVFNLVHVQRAFAKQLSETSYRPC